MVQTFFDLTAQHLYHTTTPDELANQLLIVPTRRAVWYLQDSLQRALPLDRPQRAPRVVPIEEYVAELADATCCPDEEISLHLRLYDTLKQFLPNLTFDDFAGWGPILLDDFSLIDQENGDPKAIFEYLSDAQALTRWQLDVGDDGAAHAASAAGRYLRFWEQLEPAYHAFRAALAADGLAYPGMAYRAAVAEMRRRLTEEGAATVPFHWFLGLGRLSATEAELIRLLRKVDRAEVRFDGDDFYLGASPCRARRVFQQATDRLNLPHTAFGWEADGAGHDLLTRPRAVRTLAVANPSAQGRVAGQLVADALQANPYATIAVVLPDESLLLPVLYGLPEAVAEFNVTMGLSFQATPLFSLIDLLFDVQLAATPNYELRITNYESEKKFLIPHSSFLISYHHLAVTRLLSHPLLRRYERYLMGLSGSLAANQPNQPHQPNQPASSGAAPALFGDLIERIAARNMVVVPLDFLLRESGQHPLMMALFAPWADATGAVAALHVLHDALRATVTPSPAPLEGEYLLAFYRLIRRLGRAFAGRTEQPGVRAFRLFLNARLRSLRLPFEGHPIAQVQVMGWLETRALDFDHVIILSCNEGTLPGAKKLESLLPPDLLREKGLPTYPDREADTAHQFWRLLQRAARVDLLYALPGPDGGIRVGEPSRFLLQLEHDLVPATRGATTLRRQTVRVPVPARQPDAVLQKSPAILAALRAVLEQSLSPSALNDFVGCSLKFYYKRVAKLSAADEVEEDLGANQLGTAVHQVLEWLVAPYVARGAAITAADVRGWADHLPDLLPRALANAIAGPAAKALVSTAAVAAAAVPTGAVAPPERLAPPDQGMNFLRRHVARQQLEQHFAALADHLDASGQPLTVLGQEQRRHGTVFVDVPPPADGGGVAMRVAVNLFGLVDRIDQLPPAAPGEAGGVRIVDYKSGQVTAGELRLKTKMNTAAQAAHKLLTDDSPAAGKVRQLWLYSLMQQERGAGPVEAAIVSLRPDGKSPLYLTADLAFLTEAYGLPADQQRAASEHALGDLVRRILDPAEPLRRTANVKTCEFCDFRRVCAR